MAEPDPIEPEGSQELETIDSDGNVPTSRIRDAATANAICADLWFSDQAAAFDRAMVDELTEGFSPMSQGDLREEGQGNAINVNFLGAMGREEVALSAYNNLANSTEFLISCEIPEAPPEKKMEWEEIFAQEYTRLMRFGWPSFVTNILYIAKYFVRHGVAIVFRQDSWDWRWSVSRIGDFQVQRRQNCTVDDVELAVQRTFENPPDAYDPIRNEKVASDSGWNVKATKKAIQEAVIPLYNGGAPGGGIDPAQWQRDAKDNSLFWSQGKAKQVEKRHLWVKEFDESVTHLITNPQDDKDFLFEKKNRWDSMGDCFVFFTYGVGNGDFYSNRGLGWKLFGSEQLKNVAMCKMADLTMKSLGTVWQAESPNGQEDFQSITYGSDTIAPAGFKMQAVQWPNLSASGIPFINMIASQQQANTGTYTPTPSSSGGNVEKTKAEYEGEAAQQAILSTSAVDLFYQSMDRVHQMTVRALLKDPYPEVMQGGKERWAFIGRCLRRGMTMEAIKSTCCVRAVRAIGAGSEAMKRTKIRNLLGLSQQFDPIGRRKALRLAAIEEVGYDNVDAFAPSTGERPPDDKKTAELESSLFVLGIIPEVMPQESAVVHVSEHLQFIDGAKQRLQQGAATPQQSIDSIGSALQHCQQHMKMWLEGVPSESNSPDKQVANNLNVRLQQEQAQLQKLIQNFQQQQQAQQEELQRQQQETSSEAQKQQREDAVAKAKIGREDELARAKIERDNALAENEILRKRAQANADLEHQTAETNQYLHSQEQVTRQDLVATDLRTAQDIELKQKQLDQSPKSE